MVDDKKLHLKISLYDCYDSDDLFCSLTIRTIHKNCMFVVDNDTNNIKTMANESILYNIGFEETIGNETSGMEMYKGVHVYLNKDYSEHFALPFYFLMGQHDYLWNTDGDKLLLSSCSGFFEYDADLLPDEYSRWTPLIVVADIAQKQILKVYEGDAPLCWNDNETDICTKEDLTEFSYAQWVARYNARKEEIERIVAERTSDYSKNLLLGGHTTFERSSLIGDIVDETIQKNQNESQPTETNYTGNNGEQNSKSPLPRWLAIIIAGLGIIALILWRHMDI